MNIDKLLNQFKTLAEKHLGDPPDPNAPEQNTSEDKKSPDEAFDSKTKDKVRSVIQDFQAITPLIERAGYLITDLQIELAIIPKLIPHFQKIKEVEQTEKDAILVQLQNKRLMKMLMQALFKADSFQKNLNMTQYKFKGIEVEIAPLPAVRLNYKHLAEEQKTSQEIVASS